MLTGPPRSRDEGGFTLIELIVALVLLGIVFAGIVYAVTQMSRSNGRAMNDRAAQRQALDALEQLRIDLRAARSPGLDAWDQRREALRDIIRFSTMPVVRQQWSHLRLDGCSGVDVFECMRDVTFSSGTNLWFRADVRADLAGVECIGYSAANGRLVRTVSTNWRQCGPGSGGATTVLLESRQLPANPFRYVMTWNPTMVRNTLADPADCRVDTRGSVQGAEQNFITAVDADFTGTQSIRTERGTAVNAGVRTGVQITGRTGGDYAFALGCSW